MIIRDQSGNVLFYILIGVALLAALSYAVSHTSRGSAGSVSREKASIAATEIIQYGEIVATAVAQLRLRGVEAGEISFGNEEIDGYDNPHCADDSCMVFALDGGGISYSGPKEEWLDASFREEPRYGEVYFNGSAKALDKGSESKDELIMFIPYVKKSVCVAINTALGIMPEADETPSESNGPFESGAKFTGTYPDAGNIRVSGDYTTGQSDILSPYNAGCTLASDALPAQGSYHFYKVLIAR